MNATRRATIAALLLLVGVARICVTYRVFNHTVDEPAHVASGLEWLDAGTYRLDREHPPLARVFLAIGPYLDGARYKSLGGILPDGHAILYRHENYWRNLTRARVGVLPFFILASCVVLAWSRRFLSEEWALMALALFTTTPVVLGHAGVATTDVPFVGTFLLSLFVTLRAIESLEPRTIVLAGIAAAIAFLTKFSFLVFYPPSVLVMLLFARKRLGDMLRREVAVAGFAAIVAALLIIWAGYRFSVSELREVMPAISMTADARLQEPTPLMEQLSRIPTPAPEFFHGIAAVRHHNERGHAAFLLGQHSQQGWWYYFPVALAIKTPLALLVLVALALVLMFVRGPRSIENEPAQLILIALAITAVAMTSSINIGVRHILPVYPLLAMVGTWGASRLWAAAGSRRYLSIVVAALLGWQLFSSITAHPDYFAHFNEIATSNREPSDFLLDSNLDWGQDFDRLSRRLKKIGAPSVSVAFFGSVDGSKHGLPEWRTLERRDRATGWIAISEMAFRGVGEPVETRDAYAWLNQYPYERVGTSIRLYYVP